MTNMDHTQKQKQLLQNVMLFSGIVFVAVGLYTILSPEFLAGLFLDNDIEMGRILGGCLMMVGMMDVILSKVLFGTRDRK